MAQSHTFAGTNFVAYPITTPDGTVAYLLGTVLLDTTGAPVAGAAGAVSIADGSDVAEGATTDAVVAAGAAGSISAKMRRLTTDLAAFATANHTDLIAATPAGTNLIGKMGLDQTTQGTTNLVVDSGLYTLSPGTLTTGSYGKFAIDVNSNLQSRLMATGGAIGDAVPVANTGTIRSQDNTSNLMLATVQNLFNGNSYDRIVKPNATARLLSSAATTNATSVKATAGNVFRITGNNTVASKRYLKLYNKASAPTVGTDTPILTYVLLVSAPFTIDLGSSVGHYFSTGIAFAITGAAADADTTAIASGDIECFNLTYA